jgi:signal transduction histidine kinase
MSAEKKIDILLVDDQEDGLLSLKSTLAPLGEELTLARNGKEALRLLLQKDFALILLDVVMPGMDGFETAQLIRARERSRTTPIIFLTALNGGDLPELRAYTVGAVDFVLKPYEPEILRSKVSVFIQLAHQTERALRHEQALRESQQREYRRQLEEALRKAEMERALHRADELQSAVRARDEFMSVASHELKTLITSLTLNLQGTRARLGKKKDREPDADIAAVSERLGRLDQGVGRLNALVSELLDLSRLRTGQQLKAELEEVNLAEVIREVVARFQEELGRQGCELKTTLDPEAIGLWNASRLDQVVSNILSNALKYAPGKPIEVSVSRQGDEAELSIRDHGTGIPEEQQGRIFERFTRIEDAKKVRGLGLGLWIVREIVTGMGGTINVKSSQGQGSDFIVRLPTQGPRPENAMATS